MNPTPQLKRRCVLLVFWLSCVIPIIAQNTSPGGISGRVILPGGGFVSENVRVTLETIRGVKISVFTDNQGRFVFRGLAPGNYGIVVEADKNLFEVATAGVEVFPGAPAIITISLKEKKPAGNAKKSEGVVSTAELDAAVPEKARKEFERASKAGKEGDTGVAIVHLRKAIAIYPRYLMAHNDLGAQLLQQGMLDEAAQELHEAIDIDPKAFNPHLNLGIVLLQQHNFSEASEMLRKALALEANSPAARYYSGLALMGLNDSRGAEHELKTAHELGGVEYAVALFQLGQLYMNKGERVNAAKAFENYLAEAPNGANATEARKLIALLR